MNQSPTHHTENQRHTRPISSGGAHPPLPRQRWRLGGGILLLLLVIVAGLLMPLSTPLTLAQETGTATPTPDPVFAARELGIYATTQDFSSFRDGPGLAFKRLTVIPPATTMQVIGRSPDTRWLQVEHEGMQGWIASWLLVWNGDVSKLPVDGINPKPFARQVGVIAFTTRETPLYRTGVDPSDQIGSLPAGTQVEVTARLGRAEFMQFQILYDNQVYWVGSWNLRISDSDWVRLLDTSYLYPYGRLIGLIGTTISDGERTLSNIENIWVTLDSGEPVSCNFIPKQLAVDRVTQNDLLSERIFFPVVDALQAAVDSTNAAITAFEDACARPPEEFYINALEVRRALDEVAEARRNFNIARSLLESLRTRDPLVNPDNRVGSSF